MFSTGKGGQTMERFNLFQEPLQPAAIETQIFEFGERASGVDPRVGRELGTLDQIKDDGILEPD